MYVCDDSIWFLPESILKSNFVHNFPLLYSNILWDICVHRQIFRRARSWCHSNPCFLTHVLRVRVKRLYLWPPTVHSIIKVFILRHSTIALLLPRVLLIYLLNSSSRHTTLTIAHLPKFNTLMRCQSQHAVIIHRAHRIQVNLIRSIQIDSLRSGYRWQDQCRVYLSALRLVFKLFRKLLVDYSEHCGHPIAFNLFLESHDECSVFHDHVFVIQSLTFTLKCLSSCYA